MGVISPRTLPDARIISPPWSIRRGRAPTTRSITASPTQMLFEAGSGRLMLKAIRVWSGATASGLGPPSSAPSGRPMSRRRARSRDVIDRFGPVGAEAQFYTGVEGQR